MEINLDYIQKVFARDDEVERRNMRLLARGYHAGKQTVYLSDRMKEFLELHDEVQFRMNIIRGINNALRDELVVKEFTTDEPETSKKQQEWAARIWAELRMDALQNRLHETAVSEGVAYIIVDYNEETKTPDFTFHRSYIEPTLSITGNQTLTGDGLGIWMVYQNNDIDQPPLCAVKQWTETYQDEKGAFLSRDRMTIYFPDRIERYALMGAGWSQVLDKDGNFPTKWVDKAGKPLGIPVIAFPNPDLTPEAWEAIPLQDANNKTLVDMLGAADLAGFPMLKVFGFYPTTDGQAPNATGSNLIKVGPMQFIGSNKSPAEASVDVIAAQPVDALMDVIINITLFAAQITSTPTSRFTMTKQVASAETLKEQDRLLVKKAATRKVTFGDAWEDCISMARRLANTFGGETMNEEVNFQTVWAKSESEAAIEAADKDKDMERKKLAWDTAAAVTQATQGLVPPEVVLKDFGWTDEQVKDFIKMRRASITYLEGERVPTDPITGERLSQ